MASEASSAASAVSTTELPVFAIEGAYMHSHHFQPPYTGRATNHAHIVTSAAVLELIKSAQAQNGLRHNDYARYRQYCTRRLARVRHASAVHFTFGKGKKFVKRELRPEDVTDVRHLHIPLVSAERAWAEAMGAKQEEAVGTAKAFNHMVNRLRKAAKHAAAFAALAAARCDGATALEAEAYAAGMRGQLALEEQDWEPALQAFVTARSIYDQLGRAASRRTRDVFLSRAEELAPSERYCRYNLARLQGKGAAAAYAATAGAAAGAGELRGKIAAALADTGAAAATPVSAAAASSHASVYWRRTTLPVRSEKVRAALRTATAKAQQLSDMVATAGGATGGLSQTEALYLDTLSRFDDAIRLASEDAARAAKEGREGAAGDARCVADSARFAKLRTSLDRGEAAAAAAAETQRAAGGGAAAAASGSPSATFFWSADAWTRAVLMTGAGGGMAAATATGSAAAASAALVAAWFARSIVTLDEMISLAGGGAPAATAPASSPAPPTAVAATASAAPYALPADDALIAALSARRLVALAWRCWYVAQSYAASRRAADATALLSRVEERVAAAREAYDRLDIKPLPPTALSVTADGVGIESVAALSGVSAAEAESLKSLSDRAAAASVALSAQALLEGTLAPHLRADAELIAAYAAALPALPVQLPAAASRDGDAADAASSASSTAAARATPLPMLPTSIGDTSAARGAAAWRRSFLTERLDAELKTAALSDAAIGSDGSTLDPLIDADAIAAWPPAPLIVPLKPVIFDLAFNYIAYPEPPAAKAPASLVSPSPKAAAVAAATPRSAGVGPSRSAGSGTAATGSPAPATASAAKRAPGTPAGAVAAVEPEPPAASSPGGGLLGWFTGR